MTFPRRHATGLTIASVATIAVALSVLPLPDWARPFPDLVARPRETALAALLRRSERPPEATPGLVAQLRAAGLHCELLDVPGAGHFYQADAVAVHDAHPMCQQKVVHDARPQRVRHTKTVGPANRPELGLAGAAVGWAAACWSAV